VSPPLGLVETAALQKVLGLGKRTSQPPRKGWPLLRRNNQRCRGRLGHNVDGRESAKTIRKRQLRLKEQNRKGWRFSGFAILPKMATHTLAFIRGLRDLRLTLGDLKSEGDIAALSSVVLRIVFEPELMKSISSLSPRVSLTRPSPNEACSIQS
jgi:hypothetical protein